MAHDWHHEPSIKVITQVVVYRDPLALGFDSDAQWPWEKKGTLCLLVECYGEPFPKKRGKKGTTGQQS